MRYVMLPADPTLPREGSAWPGNGLGMPQWLRRATRPLRCLQWVMSEFLSRMNVLDSGLPYFIYPFIEKEPISCHLQSSVFSPSTVTAQSVFVCWVNKPTFLQLSIIRIWGLLKFQSLMQILMLHFMHKETLFNAAFGWNVLGTWPFYLPTMPRSKVLPSSMPRVVVPSQCLSSPNTQYYS